MILRSVRLHAAAGKMLWLFVAVMLLVSAPCSYAQALRPYEAFNPAKAQTLSTSPLTIASTGKTHAFVVELADTPEQRDIGLMHRSQLAPDHGMLFNFHDDEIARFWMRNTFIPLDMLFIRADGRIAAIFENATPHSETPIGPNIRVRAVLELAGGTAARLGLKVDDKVTHSIFEGSHK